ncbi:MAG: MarR family transcriptional regulator [Candidatus Thorarchaeota archaeon]|nr:MarR family transcriptional regulator [Candidatus Thorarchaeota archaeon]
MRYLGSGELRLLGRLVINPSLRQADLAKELGVSRSAVNQIWSNLYQGNDLRIRGNLDLGKIGLKMIFGWALSGEGSDVLMKFSRWLRSSRLVTTVLLSKMSSTFDSLVYFEAVLPTDSQSNWFHSQIDRFRKKPYSLEIYISDCSKISHHMNLGLFDGDSWVFPDSFRLEASIGAASGYVDILPTVGTVEQSTPTAAISDDLLAAVVLADDYYATATDLAKYYSKLGLKPDSGRTLRRRVVKVRKSIASPYVDIDNIGLDQRLLVCIRDDSTAESAFSHVLHAQAGTFPKARVVSGPNLTLLELEVPSSVEWVTLTQVLSSLAGNASEICTFIANKTEKGTRLESVVSHLTSSIPSG